ncbi:glycerate kinase type-2 family protein [Flaviflagellibacter deserti]|jgi:glycerate 2-kinase|uniref:Glycerate kinase n=1 Tax=Flaviflagellibacter deserti TaxID=2267266 RepID=A0ABV9Z1I1_9HYPH
MAPGHVPAQITSSSAPSEKLRAMFDAAVAAALPSVIVPQHLPPIPKGRTIVIGAGKASAAMAKAVEDNWTGPLEGLVVTRYGHAVHCDRIEIVEASHPVPDAAGEDAARRILEKVQGLNEDDLVIALISGGGSALMALPAEGLTLADKQALNKALLASGASIDEMNCVRKHLSAIKGGRLAAAAWPATVVSLLISDVPGDDPSVIASGPTVPDRTTFADALAIVRKYKIEEPRAAIEHLERGVGESIKPGDAKLSRASLKMVATPQMSLEAAAEVARQAGLTPIILGDAIEGEAREVARVMAGIARQVVQYDQPAKKPCVLLSGGETTVTVRGKGRGGRNAEFLLALTVALDGLKGVHALAADTDGIDGSEDNAGAIALDDTLSRAADKGVSAKLKLADNDGYGFFSALDSLVTTGPTLTNVNDFRAILITD